MHWKRVSETFVPQRVDIRTRRKDVIYMSTLKQVILTAGIVVFALPTVSHAGPYFFDGAVNQYKYTNLENVLDANGNPTAGNPVVGDRLQGVFWATTDQSTKGTLNLSSKPDAAQVTGIFDLTVVATGPSLSGGTALVLAPTAAGAPNNFLGTLGLPANTMLAIYGAPNTDFFGDGTVAGGGKLFTDTTLPQVFSDATSGGTGAQLLGAFGYGPGYNPATFTGAGAIAQAGQANIGYWVSTDTGGLFLPGLFELQNGLFPTLIPISNSNIPLSGPAIPAGSQVPLNNPFQLVGAGSTEVNVSAFPPYRSDLFLTQSQDPVRVDVPAVATPEPSSVLLLSLGGAAMGAFRLFRRRQTSNYAA